MSGKELTTSDIKDADALLIRTRTKCDSQFLGTTSVKHIATATIGFDHIDTVYCSENNIEVSTAAGCNARAVLQWVGATLSHLSKVDGWNPSAKTLGVVGVGNVGSLVSHYASLWGFNVICCDPPRQEREGGNFISFEQLLSRSDIITFHTPLNESTYHMLNTNTLEMIGANTVIINSSRGEVIDTKALLHSNNRFVMDVWEDEPLIDTKALRRAILATPHIAGYSLQGKANATTIAVQNIANALDLPLKEWCSDVEKVTPKEIRWEQLCETIGEKFDIESLSNLFKSHHNDFELIRNTYDYRIEYF